MARSEDVKEPQDQNSFGDFSDEDEPKVICYCQICCRPLRRAPVFECEYGHLACSICGPKLENKCAFCCSSSIGSSRLEKYLEEEEEEEEEIEEDHDKYCPHVPRECPFSECKVVVSRCQLYKHIGDKHTPQNDSGTVWFVLNKSFEITLNPRLILEEESNHKLRFEITIPKDPTINRSISVVRMPSEEKEEEDIDIEIEASVPNPLYSLYGNEEELPTMDRDWRARFGQPWAPLVVDSWPPKRWSQVFTSRVEHRLRLPFFVLPYDLACTPINICIKQKN